jgi:hypothetical protein
MWYLVEYQHFSTVDIVCCMVRSRRINAGLMNMAGNM